MKASIRFEHIVLAVIAIFFFVVLNEEFKVVDINSITSKVIAIANYSFTVLQIITLVALAFVLYLYYKAFGFRASVGTADARSSDIELIGGGLVG
jgi:hypothetical protein